MHRNKLVNSVSRKHCSSGCYTNKAKGKCLKVGASVEIDRALTRERKKKKLHLLMMCCHLMKMQPRQILIC